MWGEWAAERMADGMGSLRALTEPGLCQPQQGSQHWGLQLVPSPRLCWGLLCADVSVVSAQLVLAGALVGAGSTLGVPEPSAACPQAGCPQAGCPQAGGPGEEVALALRAVHGAAQAGTATGSSVITWGLCTA